MLDSAAFQKNNDIDSFIQQEQAILVQTISEESSDMPTELDDDYSFEANINNINVLIFKFIEKRNSEHKFFLERAIESNLQVINFLLPFKNDADVHLEVEHMKNLIFTLIKKGFENSTNFDQDKDLSEKFQAAGK